MRYKNSTDAERFAVARAVIVTDAEYRAEEKENGRDAATGADEFAEPDAERRANARAVLRADSCTENGSIAEMNCRNWCSSPCR